MKIILLFTTCLPCQNITAQTLKKQADFERYIEKFRYTAIENMHRAKIPASITMAQGLLESGAGLSPLAADANNHFGIKCGSVWLGETYTKDDDEKDECFRKYRHPAESYRDHSLFLQRPRYRELFKLKITDYKGWARGLKKAGYATDPAYPGKLIGIIELYGLYELDSEPLPEKEHTQVWDEEF